MKTPASAEVTELLLAWSAGDELALKALLPLVYHTLQASALVNEAYLKLVDVRRVQWQNRAHFFGVSAQLMRRILVDFGRRRHNHKRGGGVRPLTLNDDLVMSAAQTTNLVALDDALNVLAAVDPRKVRVDETAEVLKVSSDTVARDWRLANAWLHGEIRKAGAA